MDTKPTAEKAPEEKAPEEKAPEIIAPRMDVYRNITPAKVSICVGGEDYIVSRHGTVRLPEALRAEMKTYAYELQRVAE